MKKHTTALFRKMEKSLKKWIAFFLNPRLLLCVFIAWMITNGWSYVFAAVGTMCDITWMTVTGGAYMSLLWLPFTPEKIITLIIAIFLMKWLFPNDEKTLGTLHTELETIKAAINRKREQRRRNKEKDAAGRMSVVNVKIK